MKTAVMKTLACGLIAFFAINPAFAQFSDQSECSLDADVPNVAMNCPDMFAWQKFVEVISPVPGHNDLVTFQTWATDNDTFQCPPADAATCKANPKAAGCPT